VAVDDDGLPVADLPENGRVRAAFVTPSHQFPRGGTLPLERRLALLDWARKQEALIIEDDYDSELRYDGHPLSALQGLDESGHVIYLGTFSKVLFPALRLGYVVLPPALVTPFSRSLSLVDRGAPTLTQAAVADFIAEGHFESHLRRLRAAYGERRQALVDALDRMLGTDVSFSRVPAGLHIMLNLHPSCDEAQVIRRAASAGVGVYPGAPFHLQQPAPPSILLGYSGLNVPEIEEGVRRLAEVMPRCRRET
jgi:GntR family transcriptional regulator/MocR family aminotransferase